MKTLIPISIYRNKKTITIYLDGHRVHGGKLYPDAEIILEGNLRLKDLGVALADHLQPRQQGGAQ